jgi:fluoride ion exporter CrcB/FEX
MSHGEVRRSSRPGSPESSDPSLARELPSHEPVDGSPSSSRNDSALLSSPSSSRPRAIEELDRQLSTRDTELESELPEQRPPPKPVTTRAEAIAATLRTLATLSLIAFFTFWGVLGRLGLTAIGTYSGQSVFPVIWAQTVGCLVMGLCLGAKPEIEAVFPPLYVGLTTGFCGSMTTFSTWVFQMWQAFANDLGTNHHGFHNVRIPCSSRSPCIFFSFLSCDLHEIDKLL